MNILISACLCGFCCRYDGKSGLCAEFETLKQKYTLIPVCPEQLGGLATPRPPAEICNGRVVTKSGLDVTAAYLRGAEQTLHAARRFGCDVAILKERSPSCGSGAVYDGTFSGRLVPGDGVTAALLKENGIEVLGESAVKEIL